LTSADELDVIDLFLKHIDLNVLLIER